MMLEFVDQYLEVELGDKYVDQGLKLRSYLNESGWNDVRGTWNHTEFEIQSHFDQ